MTQQRQPPEKPSSDVETAHLEIRKGPDAELRIGGVRLVACRREVDVFDGGVTLYVFSEAPAHEDEPVEFLRIDLFRERPHYHAPASRQEETAIEPGAESLQAWAIEALTSRTPALATEAGYAELAATFDVEALAGSGEAIHGLLEGLAEPDEVSYFEVPRAVYDSLAAG
ncbi:MAG: hypothetical protein CL933_01915 [Deltaproteobacteria bacterium]|nr:hypothetical protein [Deltaproteobacteria bacterium]